MLIVLSILTGLAIAIQDFRTQHISILLLGVFFLLSLGNWLGIRGSVSSIVMTAPLLMLFLILFIVVYEKLRGKFLIGAGDKILLLCSCGWLNSQQLPLFLILAGLIGCVTVLAYKITRNRGVYEPVPFAPALLISILFTRVLELLGFELSHVL